MSDLYFYSTPKDSRVELTLDSGTTYVGEKCVANGRDDANRFILPDATNIQGSVLRVSCEGYTGIEHRGILRPDLSGFLLDDVRLTPVPVPPPVPKPDPNLDPEAIIDAVFALDDHDLNTKEGCGEFTHDCCLNLHAQHSAMWGHIRKNPGQNQWDGHAVDALMLLAKAGDTNAGIYDIIHDCESPNATTSFNWKGEPDPNLWMDLDEIS